jgi:hypothetical protein
MTKVYIYIMLISIILFFSYINALHNDNDVVEQFTSINRFYRPYVRKTRRFGTKMYDKLQANLAFFTNK